MKKLFIVGAGGFGSEVLWLVSRINEAELSAGREAIWDVVGFIDDGKAPTGKPVEDMPVFATEYLTTLTQDVYAVIAIANAKTRKRLAEKLTTYPRIHFATLIDPSVLCSHSVQIGEGSIICAGNILTVNITIGSHVIINLHCAVGHNSVIEDYVTLYPSVNISGNVHVCEESELGTGMQIIQGLTVGRESIIGAGAVVIKDIPEKCTAVGTPAKPIKYFQ